MEQKLVQKVKGNISGSSAGVGFGRGGSSKEYILES